MKIFWPFRRTAFLRPVRPAVRDGLVFTRLGMSLSHVKASHRVPLPSVQRGGTRGLAFTWEKLIAGRVKTKKPKGTYFMAWIAGFGDDRAR